MKQRAQSVTAVVVIGLTCSLAFAAPADPPRWNLLENGNFASDWMHNKVVGNNRFLLLDQSDWGYAQSDGLPDCWVITGSCRLEAPTPGFAKPSLRLAGDVWQVVYLCGETEPNDGGSGYSPFRPLPRELARQITDAPVRVGVWCKADGATAEQALNVRLEYADDQKVTAKEQMATFAKGDHDWQYKQLTFAPSPELGVAHAATVKLSYHGGGGVWFAGAAAEQEPPALPNLLPQGFPAGWSKPVLWTWTRRDYYRFTGWSHGDGTLGTAAPVTAGDGHALQLQVAPGQNLAVKSAPVPLDQTAPRPVQVTARVWADNLRWLEIMATDEKGDWLPQQDFAGAWGTDEQYRNRAVGIGTHDWQWVSKYFAPRKPIKSLTLWLCARGIDGKMMGKNVVGTAWFSDVRLVDRGAKPAALPASATPGLPVATPDMGERLWGENQIRQPAGRRGEEPPIADWAGASIAAHQRSDLPATSLAFRLEKMCGDWREQYHVSGPVPFAFGTPSSPLTVRLDSVYPYPDEKLAVGVNVNVTTRSLGEIASCRVAVRYPGGERVLLDTADVAASFWSADKPRPPLLDSGFVDARNLITLAADVTGLGVHDATDPVRDCAVVVTLKDKAGKVIAQRASEPFTFLRKPPLPTLPQRIERTAVAADGTLLVNGVPFFFRPFPLGKTDLGSVSRKLNFPATHKILPLPFPKGLIFKATEDALWKQKVQAFVKANRGDPKLLGYFFDHNGETMMWFDAWRDMAACQRKAAGWAREADPNHVILGAEWLFGTGTLTPDAARHFDYLDVLDVEPAAGWTPDGRGVREVVRKPAGRGVCLVAGLECYHFESLAELRWRMYDVLRQRANDVGICPSGMLAPRPEAITFLRGLYGEELALAPMLAAAEPSERSRCDDPAVDLWERQDGKTRWLVALRSGDAKGGANPLKFTLPKPASKVEVLFEAREVSASGASFSDELRGPFVVHVYRITHP